MVLKQCLIPEPTVAITNTQSICIKGSFYNRFNEGFCSSNGKEVELDDGF